MVPLEPWEKVYIKLGSLSTFEELEPVHGKIGCAGCHRGEENLSAKDDSEEELQAVMEQAHRSLIPRSMPRNAAAGPGAMLTLRDGMPPAFIRSNGA